MTECPGVSVVLPPRVFAYLGLDEDKEPNDEGRCPTNKFEYARNETNLPRELIDGDIVPVKLFS